MTFVAISEKVVTALPPAMLLCVLLNVCFVGIEVYRTGQRNALLTTIVNSCLKSQ